MRCARGPFDAGRRPRRPQVSSSEFLVWWMDSMDSNGLSLSSDFENKFVCGEIMAYDDLHEHGSESAVKAAGKLRQQGKPYESEFP